MVYRTQLGALYGMMGDVTKMWQVVGEHGVHPRDSQWIAIALARSGDISDAAAALEEMAQNGKNNAKQVMSLGAYFPEGFFEHPDVQPAMRALRALHDDLAAGY